MSAIASPRFETVETPKPPRSVAPRSVALDTYRGLIMILLVSHGFGFGALEDHSFWGFFANQVDHVKWEGMVLWDLIQPAFMFMVGVAMPYSLARRREESGSAATATLHVIKRCLILVFLSQLFVIVQSGKFQFGLINVLSQIAFTYLICYGVMHLPFRAQAGVAVALLAGHALLFYAFPGPQGAFSQEGNVGQRIDYWLLGRNYPGLYVTINFVSSAVTTLFGVWAGMLMRSEKPMPEKIRTLVLWGTGCIAAGLALSPVIPLVKRIWTASFTLYSAGFVILGLALCVWAIDARGWRRFAYPAVAVGMNSIFAYCLSQMAYGSINRTVGVFTGKFEWIGTLAPVAQCCATLGVFLYLCHWLYRNKVFIRV